MKPPTRLEQLRLGIGLILWGLMAWLTVLAPDDVRQFYADKFCELFWEGK